MNGAVPGVWIDLFYDIDTFHCPSSETQSVNTKRKLLCLEAGKQIPVYYTRRVVCHIRAIWL